MKSRSTTANSKQQSSIMLHLSTTPEAHLPTWEHSEWSACSVQCYSLMDVPETRSFFFCNCGASSRVCLRVHVWEEVIWHNLRISISHEILSRHKIYSFYLNRPSFCCFCACYTGVHTFFLNMCNQTSIPTKPSSKELIQDRLGFILPHESWWIPEFFYFPFREPEQRNMLQAAVATVGACSFINTSTVFVWLLPECVHVPN